MTRNYYFMGIGLILFVLATTAIAYPHLPSMVPVHWDVHGNVNGWEPKWKLFVVDPAIMAGMMLLFHLLPWLSPKRFEVDSFRSTYLFIMVAVMALIAGMHLMILAPALSWQINISRAVVCAVSLLTALMGNVMGKVRRNFYVGIRTPWTIASERVWHVTHRLAAKTMFIGGTAALLAAILGSPFWLSITLIMVGVFIPVVYSLVFYKQLEKRGQLN